MRLASKFLTALEGNFDSSQVEKAFFETNQLFLSQSDVSDEDISDLLDVCKEFFPLPYLTEDKQYEQLWARLEPAYYRHIRMGTIHSGYSALPKKAQTKTALYCFSC